MARISERGRLWAKRGLRVAAVATGIFGGLYMLAQFALAKFNDMQERLLRDRVARENLRRRFLQNQEDCNFTIMALLPTLSVQIFAEMDVESISHALREQNKKSIHPPRTTPSAASETRNVSESHLQPVSTSEMSETPTAETTTPPVSAAASSLSPLDAQEGPAEGPVSNEDAPATVAVSATKSVPESLSQSATPQFSTPQCLTPQLEAPNAVAMAGENADADANTNVIEHAETSKMVGDSPPADHATPKKMSPQSGLDLVSEKPPEPISATTRLPAITKHDVVADSETPATSVSPSVDTGSSSVSEDERRATKLRLWNEIKLKSFERTFTTLYTLVFLSLQTYIQLNLLGRRAYLTALENQAKRDAYARAQRDLGAVDESHFIELHGDGSDTVTRDDMFGVDERLSQDTEKKYLTSSYWFLHYGWREVAADVRQAVQDELADMPLKTMLTYGHFEALVDRIRERVEKPSSFDTHSHAFWGRPTGFSGILLPESEHEEARMLRDAGALDPAASLDEAVTPALRALLDETKDYIDSPDFAHVVSSACEQVFSLFLSHMATSFGVRVNEARRIDKPLLLAKVLPLVSQQAQVALNATPNDYVDAVVDCRDLRALSVLMYAAWDDEGDP